MENLKTNEQNIMLLKDLDLIDKHSLPLLCALSRKRFIGDLSGCEAPEDRLGGTVAANISAVIKGADIIRVHDVKIHKQSMAAADALFR